MDTVIKKCTLIILTIVLVLSSARIVYGYSTGGPMQACWNMLPGHFNVAPQTSVSPYTVTPSVTTYSPGDTFSVTLTAPAGVPPFKGLMVQMRQVKGTIAIGQFSNIDHDRAYFVHCNGSLFSVVSHNSAVDKTQMTMQWTAPTEGMGSIQLLVTFVQNLNTFWVKQESIVIQENEVSESVCVPNPCLFGSCFTSETLTQYLCVCQPSYTGTNCDEYIGTTTPQPSICSISPCQNGGTCVDQSTAETSMFTCICPAGVQGHLCTEIQDEEAVTCASYPCQNNGTCFDLAEDSKRDALGPLYICVCEPEHMGKHCENITGGEHVDVVNCASNPCQNNATCFDLTLTKMSYRIL
ncbi:protein crumbs homolog 1-like [Anneissia japonica]|uniref:protein crumbs homolog 1-like n=1 Tax=Anneissia japonica TaxID=1529436 RepID=UPI001425A4EC|nr:protein crumbs homolog 1-like [Anneissia japonica]